MSPASKVGLKACICFSCKQDAQNFEALPLQAAKGLLDHQVLAHGAAATTIEAKSRRVLGWDWDQDHWQWQHELLQIYKLRMDAHACSGPLRVLWNLT